MQPYFTEGQKDSKVHANVIKITDISYKTFNNLLEYLYTGSIHFEKNDKLDKLIELSYAANKYMVKDLIDKCHAEINKEMKFGTVLEIAQKSFDYHLEDTIVNCLYFLANNIEGGSSLLNEFLSFPLDSLCFEFIIKNLLDYFPPASDVLGVIKSWIISQSRLDENKICDQRFLLESLRLNVETVEEVLNLKACHFNVKNDKKLKVFRRHYYKPVSPFVVEPSQTMELSETISFKRFVNLKSLTVNSRYISEVDVNTQSYSETVHLSLIEMKSNVIVYEFDHVIENVIFNDIFQVNIQSPLILLPDHLYKMRIQWSNSSIGFEYPRSIFSSRENEVNRKEVNIATFHESQYLSRGSIVHGISYEIIS